MCQRTKRFIQKRIVHLRDEAAAPANQESRPAIERIIEELQAVLRTIEGGEEDSQILQTSKGGINEPTGDA